MLSIGLMSGTSMDGIDAALLETDGSPTLIKELGDTSLSYAPAFQILLKAAEHAVRNCLGDVPKARAYYTQAINDYLSTELKMSAPEIKAQLIKLADYLNVPLTFDAVIQHSTQLHADAVKQLLKHTGHSAAQIDVVGYHGQALFHRPAEKISIIVGNGQALADQLGITVVNDFRAKDVAAGGQGAPFAPLYHQALAIRDQKMPLAVVNCGGISNITLINNAQEADLIGFDTGPGNALIDRLIRQRTQGKENMDMDGQYGQEGKVDQKILTALYAKSIIKDGQNYFLSAPPKSLDYGDMKLISELETLSLADACRTLEAFTADSIINSVSLVTDVLPEHWILAGGGWNNPVIRAELEQRLKQKLGKPAQVFTADEAGWNSRALEAQIFAYFAVRSLQKKPLSFPGTTRVPKPMTGGHTYIPKRN
jgi:anhydro-N-acetylmuramic acid kinase